MRIDRLRIADSGSPADVLAWEEGVEWEPPAGAVVVEMRAAPVNPADLNWIEGCGVVVDSPVADFSPGDLVVPLVRAGTWASHVALAPERLLRLPDGIDERQAAMLKVNPATAWRLLHGFRAPEPGGWVVQNAGNSGVGRCVIQLARAAGVRTISMVRNLELAEELQALGADHVLADDGDAPEAALEIMGGRRAALACNAVGGESALRLMNLLADGATHVTYGAMARRPLKVPNGMLIFRDIAVRGLWVTRWIESAGADELREVYGGLAARVAEGGLEQPVDSCYARKDFAAAMERQHAEDRRGKVMFVSGG